MPDIRYVQDKSDEVFYPVTHERAVRDSSGVTLSTKLTQTNAVVNNLGNIVTSLDHAVNGLSATEIVEAWDGNSVPDVTKIPAGVVVQYNGTNYTGTMQPSASTIGKVYFVGEQGSDSKMRYSTSSDGSSYSWIGIGSTDVDLSDYQRKDDEIWLTEAEFAAIPVKDTTKTYNVYEEVAEL